MKTKVIMNNQVAKDQKKRIKVRQDEIKRMAVKALIREQKHPGSSRFSKEY